MDKNTLRTVTLCVVLSSLVSLGISLLYQRRSEKSVSRVIKVKRLEIVDEDGNVRGSFGIGGRGSHDTLPRLVLKDNDGRESVSLDISERGDADLQFASDHWWEGTVILGHFGLSDVVDGTESKAKDTEEKDGAWGLLVRSEQGKFTGVGFANRGQPIVPVDPSQKK